MTLEKIPFDLAVRSRGSGSQGLPQSEWIVSGEYPVIGQGAEFIEGWTNRKDLLISPNPSLVLYGGHTRRAKYVDFPFVLGPNVKVLEAKDRSTLDHRYLFYYLSGLRVKSRGYADHFPEVKRTSIPLLPLNDQIRIAHLLGKVEGLIDQRKQHLQQLDDLLKSVFLEMFGDPVRNERGWSNESLGALATIERGRFSPRPRNDPKYYGGNFPFIQTGDISRSKGRLREYTQTLNDLGIKVSKEFKIGTIVIAIVGATIGETALLEIPTYAPDSVIGIAPKTSDASEAIFIEYVLRFWKPVLRAKAPEAARANINIETLRPLTIITPPNRAKFSEAAIKIEELKVAHQASLADLEALYGALSQQAFKGELNLSHVPMLGITPEEEKIVAPEPMLPPLEQGHAIHLPDTDNLLTAIGSADARKDVIAQWLEAYRGQLGSTPFSVQHFMAAAQTKLAVLHPDNHFVLVASDYDQIKEWVFNALSNGTLTHAYDDVGNRVELKAVQA
jgi:type I restriction enzyme, S subunit